MPLKSAFDLAMSKSDGLVDKKDVIKYTPEQKKIVDDIRTKYNSKIAQEEIMAQSRMRELPPEELAKHQGQFQTEINRMKQKYTLEMEEEIHRLNEKWKNEKGN